VHDDAVVAVVYADPQRPQAPECPHAVVGVQEVVDDGVAAGQRADKGGPVGDGFISADANATGQTAGGGGR
jgi:hypothetical protein